MIDPGEPLVRDFVDQSEVVGDPPEAPRLAFERAVKRLDLACPERRIALGRLLADWRWLLPPLAVCRTRIFAPAFARLPIPAPCASAGPVVGVPATGGLVSIGWTERRWLPDKTLAAKLRLSAFFDEEGALCWDFGVAGRQPPALAGLRAGLAAALTIARDFGASIDLTPSHLRAAWLALRLGGRAKTCPDYAEQLRRGHWSRVASQRLTLVADG